MRLKIVLFAALLGLAPALARAYVTAASNLILGLADDGVADGTGFWATVLTPPYPGGNNILYGPNALTFTGTSHMVFDLNGTPVDMQSDEPVAVPVTLVPGPGPNGLGDCITMARSLGNLEYGGRYTIVVDPHSGSGADAVQIQAWVTNKAPAGAAAASVGLRLLLDTMVGGNDGSPLSTDDGVTVYGANTLDQAVTEGAPSDWWSYDQYPSPNLTARGVTWGNQYGTPATQPDAEEFCQWSDVYPTGFWEADPNPGALFSSYSYQDTAVVLWYTNTGQAGYIDGGGVAQGDGYAVAPGATLLFTTYVGLNQSPLGASPTPYLSFTPTPTAAVTLTPSPTSSVSPTFSVSPTGSPTFTASLTWSASPTFSVSPTLSNTWTASPTASCTPTGTPSATISPSFTASPTASVSPTATATPTVTASFSATATFTASPSSSVSPTASPSGTPLPVATATATPQSSLVLTPKYPNPDPSAGPVWLPYLLTCDASVDIRIYDVAGEVVRDLEPFAGRSGANEEYWDGRNGSGILAASGVYIGHITAQALGQRRDAWVKMAITR